MNKQADLVDWPILRAGTVAVIREALVEATALVDRVERSEDPERDLPLIVADAEVVGARLMGRLDELAAALNLK